jgi:hypothetical protein
VSLCVFLKLQRPWKKLLLEAEVHAKIGLPKITMTVISLREELIDWYKRHGYADTRTREFSGK